MAAANFNTSNQTYRQLVGNGLIYTVPRFQRDYSWEEEHWDDLWRDIQGILGEPPSEPVHYMGYLVLQSPDSKSFDVIDGQQRLTTLSIIALAVLALLKELIEAGVDSPDNTRREEQLRSTFIGYLDPVTLVPKSKLNLNRNNNSYYQNHLVPLTRLPKRNLRTSEHQLRKAYEWFQSRIREQVQNTKDGSQLALLLDVIADRLFFTVITVTDELNAFKVFETLNARGVRLSSTDLLKNYLFSVVYREGHDDREIENLEDRWTRLVSQLVGGEDFPDFLRAHWNSRRKFLRHAELFKSIRDTIKNRGDAFSLIREMEEDVEIYAALPRPEENIWSSDQKDYIRSLRLFNVRQPYPLLMAAHRVLPSSEFTRLLRACSVISFRYNIIGSLATNEQERAYNSVAEAISNGTLTDARSIIQNLRVIYPGDESFTASFVEKQLKSTSRNDRISKYILFNIERQVSGQSFEDSDQYSLEHILPENPSDDWTTFSDDEHEKMVYRLGNFALLQTSVNRDLGDAGFALKKEKYRESEFETTRKIPEDAAEWTTEAIVRRQRWLAKQAKTVWRLDEMSA